MVVHDYPIRPRRRPPEGEYGRAWARDPVKWLKRKRRERERRGKKTITTRRNVVNDSSAMKRRGWEV